MNVARAYRKRAAELVAAAADSEARPPRAAAFKEPGFTVLDEKMRRMTKTRVRTYIMSKDYDQE
jgi:hypothetical protein